MRALPTIQDLRDRGLVVKDGTIRYSNGDRQVVVHGEHPSLGRVTRYSDGLAETTVDVA